MLSEREKKDFPKWQHSENSLLYVLENISDGFFILNRCWEITYISAKTEALVNLEKKDISRVLWERFPDMMDSRFYRELHRAFEENALVTFEEFSPMAHIWCQIKACPYEGNLFICIKDISERIQQEKRLEFITKVTSEVIWEMSPHGDEFSMNAEKFNQIFGYELPIQASYPIAVWRDKIHPDDLAKIQENSSYAFEHDFEFYLNEYRYKKADGNWAYVRDRTYLVRDQLGKVVGMIGTIEDISRERKTELALQDRERSYQQLFQGSPLPTWVFDINTYRFLDINHAALELYGYSRQEFLSMTLFDIRPQEDYQRAAEALSKNNEKSRSDVGTFTHLKKNGEALLVEVSISTVDFKGRKTGMAMVRDVTEKIKLEQLMLQTEINRQKTLTKAVIDAQEQQRSEFARELHDNVNQILTAAKLYVENIAALPEQSARFVQKSSELIQSSINEIRFLSRQLAIPTIKALGLKKSILELMASYQEVNAFALAFNYKAKEDKMEKGLPLTLYRIIQELLNNAVKYAKASGVRIQLLQQKNQLQLKYSDDGVGFDPAKTQYGQGIKNIKNRAEAFMGSFVLQTSSGKGCCIHIVFPLESTLL